MRSLPGDVSTSARELRSKLAAGLVRDTRASEVRRPGRPLFRANVPVEVHCRRGALTRTGIKVAVWRHKEGEAAWKNSQSQAQASMRHQ